MDGVNESTKVGQKPYLRPATLDDLDDIVDLACRAFIHDPVINYFGNVNKLLDPDVDKKDCENRRVFFNFLEKACFLIGGRINVIVDPASNDNKSRGREKVVACALWLPPKKRLAVWMVPTMLRAGVIPVLKKWGLTGLLRITVDYQGPAESGLHACFEKKGIKRSVEDSWYLQQIFTDPDYQGQGLMSQLVREAFAHAPEDTYTLEATTPKSREQYAHFGFEYPISIGLGRGKSDSNGVKARGKDATGFEIWAMTKWPESAER